MRDDGIVFKNMAYLLGGWKVDIPYVIEHEGYLLVAFISVKQTVEVLKIKLEDLNTIQMTFRKTSYRINH